LLARFQRNIGDLSWRGIDLIERARAIWKYLHCVEVACLPWLNTSRVVGAVDPLNWLFGFLYLAAARWAPRRRYVK